MTAQQCPTNPYSPSAKFDHIDLQKICEFLQEHTGKECKLVLDWYAADLGIKAKGATLCLDIDPTPEDKTHPTAVFIYKGPRGKGNSYVVALGKVKSVEFFDYGYGKGCFVEISDEAGTCINISPTNFHVFSPAYIKYQIAKEAEQ